MNKILAQRTLKFKKEIKTLFRKINEFDRICVYRHHSPDYDALGCQMAMVTFLKDNFPNKDIIFTGDNHVTLSGICFPKVKEINPNWFNKPFLAIVIDTSREDRIAEIDENDPSNAKASYKIKIDHHPNVEPFGNLLIVDETYAAAAELLANILLNSKYKVSQKCAEYLYKGIVGDSGRFMFDDTNSHTFEVAKLLFEKGLNLNDIYSQMYVKKIDDLKFTSWVLQHYKLTEHGIAYYVLTDHDLKTLNIPVDRGKDNVNLFSHIEGIHAWMSITQDVVENEWRVSLRSAKKSIVDIATKYGGGGHDQASGCRLKSIVELDNLVKDLDDLFR